MLPWLGPAGPETAELFSLFGQPFFSLQSFSITSKLKWQFAAGWRSFSTSYFINRMIFSN
jgi:hypothetical protein